MMKVDLEVLASTNIKRKKPWPKIIWIGEEQESLLLLDPEGKRISVLYVPSGKTKKRLPKLSPIVDKVVCFSPTQNGRYLLGVLQNGEVFVWRKDKDLIRFIPGLNRHAQNFSTGECRVAASNDCSYILVSVGHHNFFLWVTEKGETVDLEREVSLKGSWHVISVPEGIELPGPEAKECSMATVFYDSPVLGHCCQMSLIYNKPTLLTISTLVIKFPDPLGSFGKNLPLYSCEWSLLEYPFQQMHPDFSAISTCGAYVSCYSSNGQVMAVAANQKSPSQTVLLFVSPLTDTVLVGGMKNCGVIDPSKYGRQYWVADLAWTSDSLFLACMLRNGSVCLVPRLGEPVAIQTDGCSVNMGPSLFLPLHPAIMVSGDQGSLEPSPAEQDPMQQQFSVTTHPDLPIILFSDGFLVTVLQLPVEMTSVTLMRDFVLASAINLKKIYKQQNLDMTVADAYKLSKGSKGTKQHQQAKQVQRKPYEFEMAEISLNATHESETSMIETAHKFGFDQFGAVGNLDAGKIVFGEPEMISIDLNATFSGLEASEAFLKYLEESMSALTSAWKLAVSFPDIWTAEVDNITKQAVHNLSKIFSIVLDCPAVDAIIPVLTPRQSSAIQNPRVYNIIVVYRNILQLLRFDTYNQHVIIATLRLVHKVITLMLTSQELDQSDPRLKTLFGCFSLLKHAETCLNRVYVWVPSASEAGSQSDVGSPRMFEPATLVKVKKLSQTDLDGSQVSYKGQLPGKRLAATWKLLYKHVLEYQSVLSRAGDPNRELHQLEKLMYNVQEILQETDAEITPRSAASRLSAVWLRNAFPFGLLSESDNFSYQGFLPIDQQSPKVYTQQGNLNSPTVRSYQSSPNDNSVSTTGNMSPSSPGLNSFLKIFAYSSTLTSTSEEDRKLAGQKGSKFGIFNKIKSAVTKQKPRLNSNTVNRSSSVEGTYSLKGKGSSSSSTFSSGNNSSLRVAEYSSSPKENTGVKVTSFSSSPKESSSGRESCSPKDGTSISPKGSSSHTTNGSNTMLSSDRDSTMPVIALDSPPTRESTMPVITLDSPPTRVQSDLRNSGQLNPADLECPQSEGFELEMTHEIESSRKSESILEHRQLSKSNNKPEELLVKSKMMHREYREMSVCVDDTPGFAAKLSVDGQHTQAVEAWKEQLKVLAAGRKDSPKTAKLLHSVLYTYLMKDDLDAAMDFVDGLVLQASVDGAMSSQELPAFEDGSQPPLMTLVTHRSKDSEEEELVPCIKNKSIRQTVQTMARFMAAYFCNETMFIFPPHSAQALPSVHMGAVPTKSRIVPKYHEDITNMITRENLSGKWTTERTVEYLLLSGLVCETAWFAYKMGDWKTAFLLSVAHTSHREIAPQLYAKAKKPLQLPGSLSPEAILQERLEVLVKFNKAQSTPGSSKSHKRYYIPINEETNIGQLTRTLQDILTTALVCEVEVAPWLLAQLCAKLREVVSSLPALVPQGFYLPAPPLYCPQPGEDEMERSQPDVQYEKEIRLEISSLIQLILVLLNSAHLSLPLARWYIQELFKVQDRAAQFKATTEGPCVELPEILQQYKILRSDVADHSDSPIIAGVLAGFRDFCTILWLLHVRDELSLHLRKRGSQMSNKIQNNKESPESTLGRTYVQECFVILKWAVNLLAFTRYIADDNSIHKVLLSLILELPATEDTADILAEHFYAADNFDAEVQEKLERLLSAWQSVEVHPEDDGKSAKLEDTEEQKNDPRKSMDEDDDDDGSVRKSVTFYQASPRAKTLSVYYHKQCEVVQKVLKKKRKCFGEYDEYVFHHVPEVENEFGSEGAKAADSIWIGSRPFETKQSYMEFLDRFYAICFTKVVEKESDGGGKPVHASLMPFARVVRESEFQAFIMKHEDTFQKRPSSVVMASPRAKFIRSQSEAQSSEQLYDSKMSPSSAPRRSFFRSNSSGDIQPTPNLAAMSRHVSEGSLMTKNSPRGSRPPTSPVRGKQNMTGMASRFFQSEEVLYRDPEQSGEAHWILDVNFGQRYLALQQLLDYLNHWGSKQHSLGLHGKTDRELGIKPTMRITVPTQLVVLGLWLLENKYSGKKKVEDTDQDLDQAVGDEEAVVDERQVRQAKARALATVEELTERDSLTQVSNMQRSRSQSPRGRRQRSHSPAVDRSRSAGFDVSRDKTLDSVRSITSTQEETEQIKSAYKKVLDGGDDSSSLEVSSLEPEDYEDDLKHTLSVIGSDKVRRRRSPRRRSPGHQQRSPDRNNSTNNTLPFDSSPDRAGNRPPQTSTPVRGGSLPRARRTGGEVQEDISRISAAPVEGLHRSNTAPPAHYRGGLLGGDPGQSSGSRGNVQPVQGGGSSHGDLAGLNIAEQLQHIVRGELRRMMEVQHQSMMAMMGALDGQQVPVAWQQEIPTNQRPAQMLPPGGSIPGGERRNMGGALRELHNLQHTTDKPKKKKSKSPSSTLRGKENIDSALHYSDLRQPENIQLYRVTQDNTAGSLRMLHMPSEQDQQGVRFPYIPYTAWQAQESARANQAVPDMPLLQLGNTQSRPFAPPQPPSHSIPAVPGPGYFQSQVQKQSRAPPVKRDSLDSGIGIPLLKLPTDEEVQGRHPRFGELYPPEMIAESEQEVRQQEKLKERYLQEFHMLQAEKAEAQEHQRFGENLLHLDLRSAPPEARPGVIIEREEGYDRRKPQVTPRKSPRRTPSPRKTPRSVSEQISSKREKKSARSKSPVSEKSRSSHRQVSDKQAMEGGAYSEEESEEEEDATEAESVLDEEEADDVLHEGYVYPQGEFEAYLALEKQLSKTKDTNARIQLKTALKLQQQRMMENWKRPKVDFATNTNEMFDAGTKPDIEIESRRTSEKATSITKDTGVDPIHEAVIEYNKSREPAVLPPDIYMGLRFTEVGQQPDVARDGQESQGRAYLNVVDLDASAVLRDMGERPDQEEPVLDKPVLPTQEAIRHRIGEEEAGRAVPERRRGADELTVKLFETKVQGEDRFSLAVMPRDSMPESKFAIMQRLRDMNSQLAAIDRMSNNMDREFKNTRLAIKTLDHMTEAMEAGGREAGKDDARRQVDFLPEEESRGPSPVGRSQTPQKSARSPKMSARHSTARSTRSGVSVGDKRQMSSELAKLSGLSGISDIIGDMVAQGDIDLDDVGLTNEEAHRLVQRGAIRHEEMEDARLSLDDIKHMSKTVEKQGYDKDQLRHWMATKRRQRMLDYRRHLDELRQKEAKPYKSKQQNFDQSMTAMELKERENARKDMRKFDMTRRLDDAESLLGNLLTEKPELPKEPPARATPRRKPGKDRSPVSARDKMMMKTKTIIKRSPPSVRKPVGILKTRDVSPPYSQQYQANKEHAIDDLLDDDDYYMDDIQMREDGYQPQPVPQQPGARQIVVQPREERREPVPRRAPEKKPGVVPRLKLSLDEVEEEPHMQRTTETTGDLSAYYRAVEAMDVTSSQEQPAEPASGPSDDLPPSRPFKAKPYTDVVRVQRPQMTRKQPNKFAAARARAQTMSLSETARTSARSELTQREKEMIYGSKRMPGQKQYQATGPYRVKTYTERLQEMKPKEKYSTPVAPRSHLGSTIASQSARTGPVTRVIKPKHKPMTYVEQLQKLNEGHHKPRMGGATTVIHKPVRRSHKPAHKPLTYAEQLQALQPQKTIQGPPSRRGVNKPLPARQRPYKDPYAPLEPDALDMLDAESVVSAWSMGDDVRHLLYDDAQSSIAVGQSASYAPSEQVSDYFDAVMGDDYTASVDIDDLVQIADAGSVSSGSMASFIDWDQVDDLIADVS